MEYAGRGDEYGEEEDEAHGWYPDSIVLDGESDVCMIEPGFCKRSDFVSSLLVDKG